MTTNRPVSPLCTQGLMSVDSVQMEHGGDFTVDDTERTVTTQVITLTLRLHFSHLDYVYI